MVLVDRNLRVCEQKECSQVSEKYNLVGVFLWKKIVI